MSLFEAFIFAIPVMIVLCIIYVQNRDFERLLYGLEHQNRDYTDIMEKELDSLREKLKIAENALENWLASIPTNKDGKYDEINQWHECRALESLSKLRGDK